MKSSLEGFKLDDFPRKSHDVIRFADKDTVGHVNNAAFSSFFETGRLELLYKGGIKEHAPNSAFVLVQCNINFRTEISWPGRVDMGTGIARIGRTSISVVQALYNEGICAATSDSVIVLMDKATRKTSPLPPKVVALLETYMVMQPA